jgi:hypothetical protein
MWVGLVLLGFGAITDVMRWLTTIETAAITCNTRKFPHNKILLETWFSFIF